MKAQKWSFKNLEYTELEISNRACLMADNLQDIIVCHSAMKRWNMVKPMLADRYIHARGLVSWFAKIVIKKNGKRS